MFRNLSPRQAYQLCFDMNTLIRNTIPADEHGRWVTEEKRKQKMEELLEGLYWTLVDVGIGADFPPMSLVVNEELEIVEDRVPLQEFIDRVNKDLHGWKLILNPTNWYQGYVSLVKL